MTWWTALSSNWSEVPYTSGWRSEQEVGDIERLEVNDRAARLEDGVRDEENLQT